MKTEKKSFLILLTAAVLLLLMPLAASAESFSEKQGGNRPSDPDFVTISGKSSLTFAGNYQPDEKDGDENPSDSKFALFDTDCLRLDVKTTGVLCVHVRIDSIPSIWPQYVMTYLKKTSEPFDDKSWMNSLQIGNGIGRGTDSVYFYSQRDGVGYGRFETFLEPGEYDLYSRCFGFASTYQYDIQFVPHAQSAPGETLFRKPGASYTIGQTFSGGINNGYRVRSLETPYQNFRDMGEHYVHFTVPEEWDYTIDLWANNNAAVSIEGTGEYVNIWHTVSPNPSKAIEDTYVTGLDISKLQTFEHVSKNVHLQAGTYTARICGAEQYAAAAQYALVCYRFSISKAPDNNLRKTQTITTGASSYSKVYGSKAFSLKAKTDGDGKLTFASSNTKVAKVSSKGKVTLKAPGKAVITVRASATPSCKAASAKIKISVGLDKPSGFKAKSSSKKKISVSWKKVVKATGYQIQYTSVRTLNVNWDGKDPEDLFGPDFNSLFARTVSVKSLSKKISGLTSKKTYYVRVRAYYKSGGTKAYGGWSKAAKVTVK